MWVQQYNHMSIFHGYIMHQISEYQEKKKRCDDYVSVTSV